MKKQNTFIRLIAYIVKEFKAHVITAVICILVSAIANGISTMFLQRLIDECITPGIKTGLDSVWQQMLSIVTLMGVIYAMGVLASFIYTRIMAVVTQETLKSLRTDMFNKMESLPIKFFDTHAHGDIMSTYTNDTDALRQLIGQSLPMLIQAGVTIISVICLMFYYSIWLLLIVGIAIFCMVLIVRKVGGGSARFMVKQQKTLADEEGFIEEMMSGQRVIKVFCHEEETKKDFRKKNEELFEASKRANIYGNILMPILNNVGNILYVVVALAGAVMIYFSAPNLSVTGIDALTIGVVVSFLGMSRQLSQTIGQMSMQVSMIAMGIAGADRIFELIDREPEKNEGHITLVRVRKNALNEFEESAVRTGMWAWKDASGGKPVYTQLKGDIVLENVDFGYNEDKTVLHDVSIYAKPGEKIALVGSTGAGKTTITNLINRFYDINKGKILYDGIDIKKICKDDLRRSLGIVLQDVNLFTGTVMDNIRYGKSDATDEECIAAAKLANADDFIRTLPKGYNTMLKGNGSSLSQGQRQLLSIARAAAANSPVMILDEATSSIDTRTEKLVQDGMDKLMEGRTVFVIAHRLSTIRNSNAIMVMEHGRIIERGNHEKLIAEKGTYYQLYTGALEMD